MMDLKLESVSREATARVKAGAIQPIDKLGRLYRIVNETMLQPSNRG